MIHVGEQIRALRTANNMSQEGLGQKIGFAKSTVSMWERGSREPDFETLEKIASAFHVSVNSLIVDPSDENIFRARNSDDESLIVILRKLRPNEIRRLRDFAQGLIAARRED